MMKLFSTYIAIIIASKGFGQFNIIPNGNFESTPSNATSCKIIHDGTTNPPGNFTGSINNWETAIHSNGSSSSSEVGQVNFVDETLCQTSLSSTSRCGSFPDVVNSGAIGSKFVIIKANYTKCTNLSTKIQHGAIAVALENGATFNASTTYVIRYKIVPMRARNQDNSGGTFCTYDSDNALNSHIRFFLSEKGPANWNDNNSDQQELISVNFNKSLTSLGGADNNVSCAWQQEERVFTPDQNNYTTLVLYAETGAAAFDDVEVFERCENYKSVQNKQYANLTHAAGAVSLGTMGEKAGVNIYAGNNVDAGKTAGDVKLWYGSTVNFTAPNAIALRPGFWVQHGANFKATLLSCPNSLNRSATPENTNINPDPDYVPAPPMKRNQELTAIKNQELKMERIVSTVFPNPSQNSFTYSAQRIDINSKFTITDILGQVVGVKTTSENVNKLDFDISGLPNGVYFLNCYTAEGSIQSVHKIVKE